MKLWKDDCWTQVMILNSPKNMKHRNCAIYSRPISLNNC